MPDNIATRETNVIITHKITETNSERTPTLCNSSKVSPAPTKNSVPVIKCLPAVDKECHTLSPIGKRVVMTPANKNPIKNHGKGGFVSDLLNLATPSAKGNIHKARVSFTVIAIPAATAPY